MKNKRHSLMAMPLFLSGRIVIDDNVFVVGCERADLSDTCAVDIHLNQHRTVGKCLYRGDTAIIVHKYIVQLLQSAQGNKGVQLVIASVNVDQLTIFGEFRQLSDLVVGKSKIRKFDQNGEAGNVLNGIMGDIQLG